MKALGEHMRTKSSLLLLGVAYTTLCFGQLDRGTITGTVTDSSGGVVPAVRITIRNKATNARYESKTTGTGDYTAVNLPAGMYDVTFAAAGLKTLVRSDIVVAVSETFRLDAILPVGQSSQTLTVTPDAPPRHTHYPLVGLALPDRVVNE